MTPLYFPVPKNLLQIKEVGQQDVLLPGLIISLLEHGEAKQE